MRSHLQTGRCRPLAQARNGLGGALATIAATFVDRPVLQPRVKPSSSISGLCCSCVLSSLRSFANPGRSLAKATALAMYSCSVSAIHSPCPAPLRMLAAQSPHRRTVGQGHERGAMYRCSNKVVPELCGKQSSPMSMLRSTSHGGLVAPISSRARAMPCATNCSAMRSCISTLLKLPLLMMRCESGTAFK